MKKILFITALLIGFLGSAQDSIVKAVSLRGRGPFLVKGSITGTTITGAQIVDSLNLELGSTEWQDGATTDASALTSGTLPDARLSSNALPATVSQNDAEAGTSTSVYRWTPQRVAQAIAALADALDPADQAKLDNITISNPIDLDALSTSVTDKVSIDPNSPIQSISVALADTQAELENAGLGTNTIGFSKDAISGGGGNVPSGGTTGQVLVKSSGTDYDTEWADQSGGGVTDHGALTGLGDDDHTQYYNQSRGDARYSQLGHDHAAADVTTGTFNIARIPTGTTGSTVALGNHIHSASSGTSTAIPMDNPLGYYGNMAAASSATTYTITGSILGAWAKVRINAATQPSVTGAILIAGAAFEANTDMYLVISNNGTTVEYYFLKIAP